MSLKVPEEMQLPEVAITAQKCQKRLDLPPRASTRARMSPFMLKVTE